MNTHLKYLIAGLALSASLGLGNTALAAAQAENNSPQANTPQVAPIQLAWQRVGAPISMEG
ncbi:MAG: hypothetical protein B7Y41_09125 [Hydrogenophilales bacterium 28-61-23]|nr:MAG: hypothetical protein B7Y41_09125 [Hydrogenophilales bacterium 28-61-23]